MSSFAHFFVAIFSYFNKNGIEVKNAFTPSWFLPYLSYDEGVDRKT